MSEQETDILAACRLVDPACAEAWNKAIDFAVLEAISAAGRASPDARAAINMLIEVIVSKPNPYDLEAW